MKVNRILMKIKDSLIMHGENESSVDEKMKI